MDAFDAPVRGRREDAARTGDGLFGLFQEGMLLACDAADYVERSSMADLATAEEVRGVETGTLRLVAQIRMTATWLMLQRLCNRGEISAAQAFIAQRDVRFPEMGHGPLRTDLLPHELAVLIGRAAELQARVARLQSGIDRRSPDIFANAVERQLAELRRALNTS